MLKRSADLSTPPPKQTQNPFSSPINKRDMPRRSMAAADFWTKKDPLWPKQLFCNKTTPAHDYPPLEQEQKLEFLRVGSLLDLRTLVQRGVIDAKHPDDVECVDRLRRQMRSLAPSTSDFLTNPDAVVPKMVITINSKTRRIVNFSVNEPLSLGPVALPRPSLWPRTGSTAWALCTSVSNRAAWVAEQLPKASPNPILIITPCKYTQAVYRAALSDHAHLSVVCHPATKRALIRARHILVDSVPLSLTKNGVSRPTALLYNPLELCNRALEDVKANAEASFTLRLPAALTPPMLKETPSFSYGLSSEQAMRSLKMSSPVIVRGQELKDMWTTPSRMRYKVKCVKDCAYSGARLAHHIQLLCSNVTLRELDALGSSTASSVPTFSFGRLLATVAPSATAASITASDTHKSVLREMMPARSSLLRAINLSKTLSVSLRRVDITCSKFLSWSEDKTADQLRLWFSPTQSCAGCSRPKPQFIGMHPSSGWAMFCASCATQRFRSQAGKVLPMVFLRDEADLLRRSLALLGGAPIMMLTPSPAATTELMAVIRQSMGEGYQTYKHPYPATLGGKPSFKPCAYVQTVYDAKQPILVPRGVSAVICYCCPLDLVRRMQSLLPAVVAIGDVSMVPPENEFMPIVATPVLAPAPAPAPASTEDFDASMGFGGGWDVPGWDAAAPADSNWE